MFVFRACEEELKESTNSETATKSSSEQESSSQINNNENEIINPFEKNEMPLPSTSNNKLNKTTNNKRLLEDWNLTFKYKFLKI